MSQAPSLYLHQRIYGRVLVESDAVARRNPCCERAEYLACLQTVH